MPKLTARFVATVKKPGRYSDGGNLYLHVREGATGLSKSWLFRFMLDGRQRDAGLGSYPAVSLAEARELARERRAALDTPWQRKRPPLRPPSGAGRSANAPAN